MLTFAGQLAGAATHAGIPVPPDPENYAPEAWPYWHVFVTAQLNRPLTSWLEPTENAHVIAAIPEAEIRSVTAEELKARGMKGL